MINDEWIEKVRNYALRHYEQDGWDYLVECTDDNDIRDQFEHTHFTSYEYFFAAVWAWCKVLNDRRDDIRGTAF